MCYRRATALNPYFQLAYRNHGYFLVKMQRYRDAEKVLRSAIRLDPDDARSHRDLGKSLSGMGKWAEAEKELQRALKVGLTANDVYTALGFVYGRQGKLNECAEAYRQSIVQDPKDARAWSGLGLARMRMGSHAEALTAFKRAIALDPMFAEAHLQMSGAWKSHGDYAAALRAMEMAHHLGTRTNGWTYPTREWLQELTMQAQLEEKLPAILDGQTAPADAAEYVQLVKMCYTKKLYRAGARLFAKATREGHEPPPDPIQAVHFVAACAAVLASEGKGADAASMTLPEREQLLQSSVQWLRVYLSALRRMATVPDRRPAILKTLEGWRADEDFQSMHDPEQRNDLSVELRGSWHALWKDVAAFMAELQSTVAGGKS